VRVRSGHLPGAFVFKSHEANSELMLLDYVLGQSSTVYNAYRSQTNSGEQFVCDMVLKTTRRRPIQGKAFDFCILNHDYTLPLSILVLVSDYYICIAHYYYSILRDRSTAAEGLPIRKPHPLRPCPAVRGTRLVVRVIQHLKRRSPLSNVLD
jgi:hypothetical protein